MADIRLAKPAAGTTQTVPSAPDGRFIFDFPADAATLTRNGDDLVLSFEDGSSIRLQGFYTTYSKEDMPSFQVEGVEISGQDFFAALGEDLMPAAGPAAGSSASRGGRYNEYGGSDLLDGIDHLGRMDIGFGDGVEWADDQVGGWTHQNLDPEISGIIAVDGNDMTLVESGVETDGSQEIQGNVFTPGVPVVVGQVMASDPDGGRLSYSFADGSNRIVTEYGVITIDADTGVITYTLNNDDPDADSLALGETVRQDFTVRVEDGQGGKAEASFSVTIKGTNDQPEVTLDADSELKLTESGVGRIDSDTVVDAPGTEEENREYNGSHYDPGRNEQHLEGKVTGADVDAGHKLWFGAVAGDKSQNGSWEGAQSPAADIFLGKDATDGDVESSEPVEGNFGHLVLNSDGTWTYTLKGEGEAVQGTASLDGETFDISFIDALPEGATITDTFTIYVKDEHGAWNLETVTITITGTNDKPVLEVGEQQGLVYESGVGRDPVTDAPVDDPAGSLADENVEYDNTERGTNTTTGTISASDVDRGDTLHFAVSKKGEATEIPQNSLTDTDRPVTAQGNYGTLEVKETGNGEATYTYTLADDTTLLSFPITVNGTTYATQDALETVLGWDLGDSPTLDNLPEGATVTDTFTIFVQDDKGAWVSKDVTITITGTNDQPTVELDDDKSELHLFESGVGRDNTTNEVVDASGTEAENAEYNGSKQLTGSVTGHDVDAGHKLWFGAVAGDQRKEGHEGWEGADAPGESDFLKQNSTAGGTPGQKPVEGTFGTLTLSSDGTWIYTLKGEQVELPEGTTVTLDDDEPISIKYIDELPEDAEVTDTFTIYVKDEHGAWNLETVTITITGTNDRPKLEVGDPDKTLYESGVGRDPATGVPVGDPGHENDPYDNATAGTHTTTGTITASDADLGNTLHFAVSKKGEATEVPQDKLTDTDRSVTAQGSYGKLVVQETGNGEATYTYTLNENSDDIPLSVPVTINGTTYDDLEALKDALQFDGDRLTLNNLPEGATVTDTFTIFVQDDKGAWVSKDVTITITGTNDQPTVELDREHSQLHLFESGVGRYENGDIVRNPGGPDENNAYNGSTELTGKVTGADVDAGYELRFGVAAGDKSKDGSWEGADAPGEDDFLEQDSTTGGGGSKSVVGTFGTLTLSSDGTWVYTLKGEQEDLPEGVEIALDGKIVGIGSIDELPEGAEVTDTFTIYVKDEHGAWNLETVTITITGTNDRPKLEVGDPDKTLYESGVGRDPATGVPVGDPGHENDPYDNATAGTHTTTGTITASDADLGNTLHFAVSKKGEATEVPQDKLTDTDRSVTAQGSYGKLVVQETGNGEATYTYTLNENSDDIPLSVPVTINGTTYDDLEALKDALQFDGDRLTLNNLPEGATVTDTFTIFVQDDKGAWVSKDVTITITGTNDQPTVELDREHSQLHLFESGVGRYENGDIVRNPGGPDENNAYNGSTELTGKVTGADVDAGYELRFGVAAGDKSKDGSWEGADAPGEDDFLEQDSTTGGGGSKSVVGTFGTLTLSSDGTWVYTLKGEQEDLPEGVEIALDGKIVGIGSIDELPEGAEVTDTFTIYVKDEHGAWNLETVTITITGTNDRPKLEVGDPDKTLYESGVGRDPATGVPVGDPGHENDPYDNATAGTHTTTGTITASDVDLGNTLHFAVSKKGEATEVPQDSLTDGKNTAVMADGQFGTLKVTEGEDGEATYTYTLNEDAAEISFPVTISGITYASLEDLKEELGWDLDGDRLTLNNLPESATVTDSFTIFVQDDKGAWVSKDVTITIKGTNDQPELEVLDDKTFFDASGNEVSAADGHLHAYGTADTAADAVVKLTGRVQASDVDLENGGGKETTSGDNHGLEFSLQEKGYDSTLTSSSVWTYDGKEQMGAVNVTQNGDGWTATTPYGTLTLDQYGNYTYKLHKENDAVTKLGEGETVTETFVVRVVDDRGAWSEKTITITIEGTNDKPVISEDTSSSLTVHETGVWGDKTGKPEGEGPDDDFTGNTGKQLGTVHFEEKDANDTHSLVIAGDLALTVKYPDGWTGTGDATYSITNNGDGTYTLEAIIPGVNGSEAITLGELTLQQGGEDGTLTYTFTPNQDGLNGLPQDMDLSIDIPLKVEDQHGSLSDTTHTATINIHGTNDRPTIAFGPEANEHVYADGVGRENGGTAVKTTDKNTLNPEENKGYESREVIGQLTADDADAAHELTFFVDGAKATGAHPIPLDCTFTDGSVTLTLDGVEVAKLVLNQTTGKYILKLLETPEAKAALEPYGENAKFSFEVTFNVRDEHGSTAETSVKQTFTIHGTNDAPVISEAKRLELVEGGEDKSEKVEATDPDTKGPGTKLTYGLLDQDAYDKLTGEDSASVKMQDRIDTDYGFLEIDAKGEYTFHLDNDSEAVISLEEGQEETLTFYVAVRDDKGAWDVQEITVTITGKDTATVFTGDAAVVTVVEKGFGHYDNPVDFPGGPDRGEPSFASGRLEAKDFDTDADGKPHEVEFSIKPEGETEPETQAFRDLGDDIQNAIEGQFPDGEDGDKAAWADDADIQILKGTYGTLYLNTATGQYFYQLDNADPDTQGLKLGEIQYDDFTIHAQGPGDGEDKGADQPLKVAVQGSNDAPEITKVTLDTASKKDGLEVAEDGFTITGLKEDGTVTEVKGSVVAKDVDSPDGSVTTEGNVLKYLIKVVDGDKVSYLGAWDNGLGYLKLDENTGDYTFVFYNDKFQYLKEGQPKDVTFTVVAVDEHNAVSEERELTFTITGTDDAPVITGSSASITEDDRGTADLSATISDDDNGATPEITKVEGKDGIIELTGNSPWEITGQYGTLTVTRTPAGELKYEYTLTEDLQYLNVDSPSLKEEFIVHGQSGDKDAQGTITVTITGENDAPTLKLEHDAGTETTGDGAIVVKDWEPVTGTADGHDVDNTWEKEAETPELRYSVSKGEDTGGEPGEGGEEQASSLQTIKGTYGYLTIDSVTGKYTYVVDPVSENYQGLKGNGPGEETFTIWVKDPHGDYAKQEISFEVSWAGGTGSGESITLGSTTAVAVTEDDGDYDVTLPPSVDSGFKYLTDSKGEYVGVSADQIWLEDAAGNKSHVIQTDYGSLILEKNENGEWGYRFVLNNSSEAVQELTEDDVINLEFRVGTANGKVPINVTIKGINDQPVIESVTDLKVKDTGDGVSGQIETSDRDEGDVGNTEDGAPNLSYEITANGGSVILTRDDGGTGYGPGTYMVKKDGEVLGKFTLKEDGSYSFTPDEGIAADLPAGDSKGFDLTITVKDDSGQENDSASDTIHITIEGTNEAPEIVDAPSLEVKEDVTLTNEQQLEVLDDRGDGSDNLSYSVAAGDATGKPMAAGQYGTLFIDAQGKYHYQLNNQLKAVQELGEGRSLKDTFTIFVKDKDGAEVEKTVTVNIEGTNDDPVLSLSDPVLTIKEGAEEAVGGTATASDVDKNDTQTYSLKDGQLLTETGEYTYETDYGTFHINTTTGAYYFELNNTSEAVKNLRPTDVATATVTVVVTDSQGGSTTKDLTVHIKGTDSKPEVTAPESLEIDVAEALGSETEGGQIKADGWDRGPAPDASDDPLHYSAVGAKPVTIDGEVWHKVEGDYGILYIDPKTGKYRYELTKDMEYLAEGENPQDIFDSITITDSTGNTITETITVTIKGENDAPSIVVSQSSGSQSGTVTITDVDTRDTHEVTFTGLYGSEEGEDGDLLKVDLKDGLPPEGKMLPVYNAEGIKIGDLKLTYTKGEDAEDKLEYTFEPDKDYLNSLPVGEDKDIDFGITVSDGHVDGTATQDDLHFTVSNPNDAPEIAEDASQLPSEENNNEGKLVFTDADVWDTHSVTFDGLYADNGNALTVDNVESLTDDKDVPVYNKDGLQIGKLTLSYKDGELTYTLSTEGFENNLPVDDSTIDFSITVSDGHADGKTTTEEELHFTVSNPNDAPVISDESTEPNADNTGTLVFTDADVKDTHSVTFDKLQDVNGEPLTVELDNLPEGGKIIPVYQDGTLVGELTLTYSKGEDGTGTFTYAFDPDKNYLNSLPVGENKLDFGITVSDKNGKEDTQGGLNFTVTNENDAPVITEESSSGSNTGTLVFSDADVRDTHSVTFEGLYASVSGKEGDSLKVDNVEGLTDGATTLDVYNESGQKIGTLKLAYTEGDGAGTEHTLTYTFTPDTEYSNSLDRDSSVSLDFDLKIHDDTEDSNTVKGSVTIESTNQAPVIGAPVDGGSNTGTVAITDSDPDDSLTVYIKDAEGTPVIIAAGEEPVTVDDVSYTYTDGTLRYEVLPERTDDLAPGKESTVEITVFVDDGHGKVEQTVSLPVTSTAPTEGGEGEGPTEGETVIVPDDGDQASLKAYGQRQRLAAEEAGLLTAASFVAGITPEPAAPETFLQDTVPAQENGPEALVAEEVPLPQDETVLQEEMTDLPDADVPVSETPLADDLLAEPLLFAGLENADEMPEPVEMLRFETAEDMLPAEDTDPATAATPPAFSGEESGDGGLLLPEGVEGLFGTDGDDYLRGGEGSDAIFGGAGNDIIVYDQQDYLVSGGSGIDFMVSDDTSLTLDGLLSNTSSDKPLVSGIEVLLKGEDALSLTSINDLADRYGITLRVNEAGEETLQLDDRWTKQDDGSYDFNGGAEADGGLTLETSLTPVETGDPASEAVQQQVFTLEHSNG